MIDSSNLIRNTSGIPDTHYFVYRSKKYPIKYDFFKYSSIYFQQHHKEIKKSENIQLLDSKSEKIYDLSDDTIHSFINFIQCNDIKLTPENVVDLNYLSTLYEVPTLKQHTEDFISKNHQKVAIQLLQKVEKSDTFNSANYEDMISDSLEDYIQDDRLLSLHISTLYRILRRYRLKKLNQQTKKEVVDFVFKVLKEKGREASVLFSEIDFGDAKIECINRLLNEFSTEFDFNFINSSLLLTIYETNSRLILNEEKHKKEIDELNRKLDDEIQRIEKKSDDELNRKLNEEIEKIEKKNDEELKRQKDETNEMINQIRIELMGEIKRLQNELNDYKNSNDEKLKNEMEKRETSDGLLDKKITGLKDEFKKTNSKEEKGIELLHKEDFKGIIKYLTDKTGGNIHDNNTINVTSNSCHNSSDQPKNLLDFNCENYYQAKSKNDSWICFNFKNKRIKITSYSIKSHVSSSQYHLKSWILEVSNDGQNWINIDEHQNCEALNGSGNVGTFNVKSYGFTQYVRLHQTDTPWGGHNLWFHYLEFYGYLKE